MSLSPISSVDELLLKPLRSLWKHRWILDTNVCDHWDSQGEHYQADNDGKLVSVRTKYIRPVIDHARYKGFHDAEFAVNAEYLCEKRIIRI